MERFKIINKATVEKKANLNINLKHVWRFIPKNTRSYRNQSNGWYQILLD